MPSFYEAARSNLVQANGVMMHTEGLPTKEPAVCKYLEAQTVALTALTQATLAVADELRAMREGQR